MTVVDYNKVISAITMSIHNVDEWKDIDIYKEKIMKKLTLQEYLFGLLILQNQEKEHLNQKHMKLCNDASKILPR